MAKGDAGAILEYFQKMQSENSSYFCSMQLDVDDMITNIFWADARSVSDYGLFGDVVCFDMTYRTNEYGRPFAPFVGVNHHKQTILFGAALLYDETVDSFKWLFKTFLNAMSGKQPKTILTDQSAAMANAISQVFTQTYHRLCVWHIYQNAAKHLSQVFHGSKKFVDDFSKLMYDYEDEVDWLLAWDNMLEEYGLKENKWLKSQFEIKGKWAFVYGRQTFTSDMKSTQRSESMNNVLKKYLKPSHNLLRFFEHYERVLADRRYEELLADFRMLHTTPVMSTNAEMLQHGVEVYTPEVYKLFEDEYMRILNYNNYKICKDGPISSYKVCYTGKTREHLVSFEAETQSVTCSCRKFTFVGILCAHALKVLDKKNVKKIPPQCIENRWTRDAKARSIINYTGVEINGNPKESMGKRYSHLCRNFREIASFASEHKKLSTYAHECLVELLRNLEQMKRTLCPENAIVDHNSDGGTFGESVQVEMVAPLEDGTIEKVAGVKRKATVGRPKDRFKDPLERKRKKSKSTTTKTSKSIPTLLQDSQLSNCNSQEQIVGYGGEAFDGFTQDSFFQNGLENSGAASSCQRKLYFTQLLQQTDLPESSEGEEF